MANVVKHKRSSTAGETPAAADLEVGEIAINTADAKLFVKHTDGNVVEISGSGGGGGASLVWTSGNATTGTINYWAKVATFAITGNYNDGSFIYAFFSEESGTPSTAIIQVSVRQNGTGQDNGVDVELISAPNAAPFSDDSFKLLDDGSHTDIELWVKKNANYHTMKAFEIGKNTESVEVTYHQNSTWQSTEPTGTGNNVKSDGIKHQGNKIWHAGNDGANSGLDADLLDGQHGSYYLNLANATGEIAEAASDAYGGLKIGYSENGKNYPVELNNDGQAFVNVPWVDTDTNTTYSTATSSTLGLVKIGYTESGKNYPVELDNGQMYVNVPWTDNNTTYSTATSSTAGLVKIGYTESGKNYPVELDNGQMYVNVPWVDTNTTYSAGTGIDLSGTTFSLSSTISGARTFSGNVTVSGNLTVSGSTTTVNSGTINLADSVLTLNSDLLSTVDPSENAGFEVNRGTGSTVGFIWNETNDEWTAAESDGTYYKIWHAGNDGSGSGLDADKLDGLNSGSFLRSDANDTYTGLLSFGNTSSRIDGSDGFPLVQVNSSRAYFGSTNRSKTVLASNSNTGAKSVVSGTEYSIYHDNYHPDADNADTVDNLHASSFLRSDAADSASGQITFTGKAHVNTNTNTQPLVVSRGGSNASQRLNIGITDTQAIFNYVEDTSSEGNGNFGSYQFQLGGNDGESTLNTLYIQKNYTRIATLSGNVQIGPQNTSYTHFYTDRPAYYFDKKIHVDTGELRSHDEDLNLNRAGSTSARIRITSGLTHSDQSMKITSGTARGLEIFHDTFGEGLVLHRNHATNAASIAFKNTTGQTGILYADHSSQGPRWRKGTATANYGIFYDEYHPNADKWTTARTHTVNLTGDVTGSASQSVDGTGNRTWNIATTLQNQDEYAPRKAWTSTLTKDSYTRIARVTGNDLATITRFSFAGTTGSVVVGAIADIIVNHSADIHIQTQSGDYTQLTLKVHSNGSNEDYDLYAKYTTGSGTSLSLRVEAYSLNDETITANPTATAYSGGTELEHAMLRGTKSSQSSSNADIWTDGNVTASNMLINQYLYHSGDLNTYMEFQGADQWRVVTGGSQKLKIDTSIHLDAHLKAGNFNISEVNALQFNDPGPNEGLEWVGGSGWKIYESPDDLTTNSGGNLQFVTGSTRRMTLQTDGDLNLLGENVWFDGSNTYLRSDNEFKFLTDGGSAQRGRFKSLQVSTNYSGTPPDNGILFGTDVNLYRNAANELKTDDQMEAAAFKTGSWTIDQNSDGDLEFIYA